VRATPDLTKLSKVDSSWGERGTEIVAMLFMILSYDDIVILYGYLFAVKDTAKRLKKAQRKFNKV
jgi:hypothetical protein